jgi:outer membrane protein assembly factor BamB
MISRCLSIIWICLLFFSCSSISIKEKLNIDTRYDWLSPEGNPQRTNISKSDYNLNPPFKKIWEYSNEASFPVRNLVVSDGLLFSANLKGEVYAVNVSNGSTVGSFSTSSPSSINSILISKNNIILSRIGDNRKSIISYNVITGNENWSRDFGDVQSSPALVDISLIIGNMEGNIFSVNPESGYKNWNFSDNSEYKSNQFFSSPSVYNSSVYAGNVNGTFYSIDLKEGNLKWKFKTGDAVYASASIYRDKIFFWSDDLNVYCLDTSGSLIWEKDLSTKSVSSFTFYNNLVITSAIDGFIYALRFDNGETIWKFKTNGAIWATPLVHQNKIFIGSFDKNIYCLNADNGDELWYFTTDGKIRSNVVIWKDLIFASSDDKTIYCFK